MKKEWYTGEGRRYYPQPYRDYLEVHQQLQESIREELDAISCYRRRATYARAAGFGAVADRYEEVANDEEHHAQEFMDLAKKLKPKR